MIAMNENRRRLVGEIYDYIHKLVWQAEKNNWKIVIWGFGRGGKFLRHLIQSIGGVVSYIIDEKLSFSYDSEPAIYRSSLLEYIDSSEHIIFSSIKEIGQIEEKLLRHGYCMGKNLFNVYADIGDSYIEFLQIRNKNIDFRSVFKANMEDFGREYNEHIPLGHSCVDHVFDEIMQLDDDLSFFDFGCGKGAAILMAYIAGINKLGGVEIVKDIYDQCVTNMNELNIDCNLVNEDATRCEIDDYNCFFFFNPFGETILKKVLSNIQKSFIQKRRKIYLIYGNPFLHKCVVKEDFFILYKQVRTDFYDPLLNIYIVGNI